LISPKFQALAPASKSIAAGHGCQEPFCTTEVSGWEAHCVGNRHCKLLYDQLNAFKRVILSDPTVQFVVVYNKFRVMGSRRRERGESKGRQSTGWKTQVL